MCNNFSGDFNVSYLAKAPDPSSDAYGYNKASSLWKDSLRLQELYNFNYTKNVTDMLYDLNLDCLDQCHRYLGI